MKKLMPLLLLIFPYFLFGQFGIKAGINFANVTNGASINNSSQSGFHAGVFLSPPTKKIISSKTELIFSRQGYNYKTNTNTGNVNLDYIMLPQYMAINITRFAQIHIGAQMAFLISAKVDSSTGTGTSGPESGIMDLYNRFDYGYGGGLEIYPISGLIIGARLNVFLGDLYKDLSTTEPGSTPSFVPEVNVSNNLFQIYVGWKFGGNKKEKKEKKEKEEEKKEK